MDFEFSTSSSNSFFLMVYSTYFFFFFSSRRRHTRCLSDWSSDVCSSDLSKRALGGGGALRHLRGEQRQAERGGVREHVARVGQQRQGAGEPTPDRLGDHHGGGDPERDRETAPAFGAKRRAVEALRRGGKEGAVGHPTST